MLHIDAHAHLVGDHGDTVALLRQLDLKVLNIGVVDDKYPWREALRLYRQLAAEHPEHYAWVTTFELPDWSSDWADRVIGGLARDFQAGAVGAKVWKNIGMAARKPDGSHLLIDDPVFEPIFTWLAREGRPLLMHIAEPLACWQPLRDGDPHSDYYRRNPQWHMYGKPVPSHARLMAARDAVIERHPTLRVIGAHLGSLEYDLNEIAQRFDRYPNFAVDTSGRLRDLTRCDTQALRDFLHRHQDRVLWSTDLVRFTPHSQFSDEKRRDDLGHIRRQYDCEFRFFESDQPLVLYDQPCRGLGLPQSLLARLYHDNAVTWYPGLD